MGDAAVDASRRGPYCCALGGVQTRAASLPPSAGLRVGGRISSRARPSGL